MALPDMPPGAISREFLRVGGGYGADAAGVSPAGGLDVDRAGNAAMDGDLTVGGDIEVGGALHLGPDGVDRTWSHYIGAQEMAPITAGPLANQVFQPNRVVVPVLSFDPVTDESACFTVALPEDYDGGPLRLAFYWTATAGTAGDVTWAVNRGLFLEDVSLAQDVGGPAVSDPFVAPNGLHIAEVSDTPGLFTSGLLTLFLRRLAGVDTFDAEALLIGVRIRYA